MGPLFLLSGLANKGVVEMWKSGRVPGWALFVVLAGVVFPASSLGLWVSDGNPLCTATGNQYGPVSTSDDEGGVIVTWYDYRSGTTDVYAQRANASGAVQWALGGEALCKATGSQGSPKITSDGAGGAIVTWHDDRSGFSEVYAQRVDASGAVQWTADGVAICTSAGMPGYPAITSDGAGGAIVTWHDERSGWMKYDIYAQRVDASGVVQWAANGVALSRAFDSQFNPAITSDGAGGAIVTWEDFRNGSNHDIYARRVDASGAVQWAPNGVALCAAAGDQRNAAITSDDAGGAVVTWNDMRSGNYDIYVQRVDTSGDVKWATNGVALCTATGDGFGPVIMPDGESGAIVAWQDSRSGGNSDIYAQMVNASGGVEWASDGVALCTATGDQAGPTMTSDGAGGAIVTWVDHRSGADESSTDIYARRVSASGVVQWAPDGVALCTATGGQHGASIASDGADGALVTWDDGRSSNVDIYAQRIDGNGHLIDVGQREARVPASLLEQNVPNPFNPVTAIRFAVAEPGTVRLVVYDVGGRPVRVLVEGVRQASWHEATWDGRDDSGQAVASGVYVYQLERPGYTESKKMVLLR